MGLIIAGFSSTDKVPGAYLETVYGAGGSSFASVPLYLLLTGNMTSTGTSTADQSVDDIYSEQDAINYYGPGSELHRMCRAALRVPGIRLKAAPVAEGGSAAAGTATITISGTWSSAGTWVGRIAGERVQAGVGSADSAITVATSIVKAINARAATPVIADNASGTVAVVTVTSKNKGPRANQIVVLQDVSQLPAGCASALAGGTSIGTVGSLKAVPLSGGATVDDVTNILAVLFPGRYHRIAPAQADAVNAALWKTQIGTKAGVLEGRMEHVVMAGSGTQSATKSIAQTTVNDQRFQYGWLQNSETPPAEISAVLAAVRLQAEQSDPDSGFDNYVLPGVVGQYNPANVPNRATLVACLDNSLTPLLSQPDGTVIVVRSITTRSMNGANPDYTTLDTSQAVVPDYVRDVLRVVWTTQFVVANPKVRNEPNPSEPTPPSGMAYPSLWRAEMVNQLRQLEAATIITQVTQNMPIADYDSIAQRIMAICPVVPSPIHHQIGVSVRQLNAA